jgi:hypothetical protein
LRDCAKILFIALEPWVFAACSYRPRLRCSFRLLLRWLIHCKSHRICKKAHPLQSTLSRRRNQAISPEFGNLTVYLENLWAIYFQLRPAGPCPPADASSARPNFSAKACVFNMVQLNQLSNSTFGRGIFWTYDCLLSVAS